MSDNGGGDRERWRDSPPPQAGRPEPTRAERRADEKADKARRKAMRPWYRKKRWIAAMVIGALIVLPALAGVGGDPATTATTASGDTAAADTTPTADEPEPAADEPGETRAQENARRKAESYLQTQAFSKQGLIDQLEFEGYEPADARYGVNAVDADWKEQAALKAEQYLDTQAFSRAGLIDQLEFEGFTTKQATYGVDQTGL